MFNPLFWLRSIWSGRHVDPEPFNLLAAWRKQVWDWHVPLQEQADSACMPFILACEQQRENQRTGQLVDKKILQQEFAALIHEMVFFNQYMKEEFFIWYKSQQAVEWRNKITELNSVSDYLMIAKEILEEVTESIVLATQQQAMDLITSSELYSSCVTKKTIMESEQC